MKSPLLLIPFLLLLSCASSPGYQSFYVGDGNLQWYVEPVTLSPGNEGTVTADFTYRRIMGQENFVRFNFTWNYRAAPQGIPTPTIEWEGQDPVAMTKVEVLYQEQVKKTLRLACILSESDFLRLVHHPRATLVLTQPGGKASFATGPAFEAVMKTLAIELP